jgi:tetratricopeptide (TPR) repeat protein
VPVWIRSRVAVVLALSVAALLGCGWRVTEQNRTWRDNPSLWSHTNEIAPDTMIARMNLGNHYLRHDLPEKALEQYEHFARVRPDYVRAWRSCGRAARAAGRHEEAIGYFLQGIEVADSKNPRAYTLRTEYADYLRGLGRYDEALTQYRILLERNPPNRDQLRRVVSQLETRLYSEDPPAGDSSSVD